MSETTNLHGLVEYLDQYLDVQRIPDKSPNGLQVEGKADVTHTAFAVDASVQTIDAAVASGADLLIVHHGLWWGRHEQIVGTLRQRIAALIQNNISLYAAHIPLDAHKEVGNNYELARLLELEVTEGFGDYHGVDVGVIAGPQSELTRDNFLTKIEHVLSVTPTSLPFGPSSLKRIAIISGAAAMSAEDASRAGCDTFFTGETSHSSYHMAKECGINLIFGGHYATETVGLQALARHIENQYPISTSFLPAPTGF